MLSLNLQIISVVGDLQPSFFSISCLKQNIWSTADRPALNPAYSSVSIWENSCPKKCFIIFLYNRLKMFNTVITL